MTARIAARSLRFQIVRLLHRDNVVAGIDEVDVAGDAGGKIGQQVQRSTSVFVDAAAAPQRRMLLLEREQGARTAEAGAGRGTDRPRRNRVDANAARAEI